MEVSPNALRKDTVQAYAQAKLLLEEIETDGGLTPLKRYELKVALLQTKAQCLNTLTLLSDSARRK